MERGLEQQEEVVVVGDGCRTDASEHREHQEDAATRRLNEDTASAERPEQAAERREQAAAGHEDDEKTPATEGRRDDSETFPPRGDTEQGPQLRQADTTRHAEEAEATEDSRPQETRGPEPGRTQEGMEQNGQLASSHENDRAPAPQPTEAPEEAQGIQCSTDSLPAISDQQDRADESEDSKPAEASDEALQHQGETQDRKSLDDACVEKADAARDESKAGDLTDSLKDIGGTEPQMDEAGTQQSTVLDDAYVVKAGYTRHKSETESSESSLKYVKDTVPATESDIHNPQAGEEREGQAKCKDSSVEQEFEDLEQELKNLQSDEEATLVQEHEFEDLEQAEALEKVANAEEEDDDNTPAIITALEPAAEEERPEILLPADTLRPEKEQAFEDLEQEIVSLRSREENDPVEISEDLTTSECEQGVKRAVELEERGPFTAAEQEEFDEVRAAVNVETAEEQKGADIEHGPEERQLTGEDMGYVQPKHNVNEIETADLVAVDTGHREETNVAEEARDVEQSRKSSCPAVGTSTELEYGDAGIAVYVTEADDEKEVDAMEELVPAACSLEGELPQGADQEYAQEKSKIAEPDGVPGDTADRESVGTVEDVGTVTHSEEVNPIEIHKLNTCLDPVDDKERGVETSKAMDVEPLMGTHIHEQEHVTENTGPEKLVPPQSTATELSPNEELHDQHMQRSEHVGSDNLRQEQQQQRMTSEMFEGLAPTEELESADLSVQTGVTEDASSSKDVNMNQQYEPNNLENTQGNDNFDMQLAREDLDQLNTIESEGTGKAENQPQALVPQATNDLDKTLPQSLDPSEETLIGSVESLEPTEILDQYLQQFEESNLVWNLEIDSNLGGAENTKRLNKLDDSSGAEKTDNLRHTQRNDLPGQTEMLVNVEPDANECGMHAITEVEGAMQLDVLERDAKLEVAEYENKFSQHDNSTYQARDEQPADTSEDSQQAERNKWPKELDQPPPFDHKGYTEVPRDESAQAEHLQSVMPTTTVPEAVEEEPTGVSEMSRGFGQDQHLQRGDHDGAPAVMHQQQHLRSITDDDLEMLQPPGNADVEHETGQAEDLKQEDIQQRAEPQNPVADEWSETSQPSELIEMAERLEKEERLRGEDEGEGNTHTERSRKPDDPPEMPASTETTKTEDDIAEAEQLEQDKSQGREDMERLQSLAPTADDEPQVAQSAEITQAEASRADETASGSAEAVDKDQSARPVNSQEQAEPLELETSQPTQITEVANELDECANLPNKDDEMKEEVTQVEFLKATGDEHPETTQAMEMSDTARGVRRDEAISQGGNEGETDIKRLRPQGDQPDTSRSAEITEVEVPPGTRIRETDREMDEAQGPGQEGHHDSVDHAQPQSSSAYTDGQSEMSRSTDVSETVTKAERIEHSEEVAVQESADAEGCQPECPAVEETEETSQCDEMTEGEMAKSANALGKDQRRQTEDSREQAVVQLQPLHMTTGGRLPPEEPESAESMEAVKGNDDADDQDATEAAFNPPLKLVIDEPTGVPQLTEVILTNEDTNPKQDEPGEGTASPSLGHECAVQGDVRSTDQPFETSSGQQPERKDPEITGKNIKDTLQSLIHCNVVESSHGMILEPSEKGNMHISKYKLMNPDSQPEIQKEKTIHGDIGSILNELLTHREPQRQEVAIEKEERGNLKEILDKLMTQASKCEDDREDDRVDGTASEYPDTDASGIQNGILIQECLQGSVKMTVYSLQNQDDNGSSQKEEVIAGNVKGAKESLLASAEKTMPRKLELDYIRKGNVRFYTTCINSGALGYLQLLQDQGEQLEAAASCDASRAGPVLADTDERVDVKAIRKSFEAALKESGNENAIKVPVWPQYCASNIKSGTASEKAPGEAVNATPRRSEAPAGAAGCAASQEAEGQRVAQANISEALLETQSTHTPQPGPLTESRVQCEEVVKVNVKDARRSFEEAKQLVREVQREEVIRGNVEAAKQSLMESFSRGKEVVRQVDIVEDLQTLQRNAPLVQHAASMYHDGHLLVEVTNDNNNRTSGEEGSPAAAGTPPDLKSSDTPENKEIDANAHRETQDPTPRHPECRGAVHKDAHNTGGKLQERKAPQESAETTEQSPTENTKSRAFTCVNENTTGPRDESEKGLPKQAAGEQLFKIPPPEPAAQAKHANLHEEELPLPAPPFECELEGSLPPPPPEVLAAVVAEDLPLPPPPPPPDTLKDDSRPPSYPASPTRASQQGQEPTGVRKLPFRVRTLDMPGPPISSYAPIPFRKKAADAQPSQDKAQRESSIPRQNDDADVANASPNKLKQHLKNQESSSSVTLRDINAINKYLESNVENFHITSGPIVRSVVFKPDKSNPLETAVISPQCTSPQKKPKPVAKRAFKTPLMIAEENFKRQQAEKLKDKTAGLATSVQWRDTLKGQDDDTDRTLSNEAAYPHHNPLCDERTSSAHADALSAAEGAAQCVIFTNKALTNNRQLNQSPQRPTEAAATTPWHLEAGTQPMSTQAHVEQQSARVDRRTATGECTQQQCSELSRLRCESSVGGGKGAAGAEPQGSCSSHGEALGRQEREGDSAGPGPASFP
ncbi:uncharacterized protein LOC116949903 [Petromyzon marinus]|uniref:Titin-like n=1 Tax=Petromyzon marinus TaxID=7757 RepID=A0AAJ7TSC7_PETMA|nr:titin-like [Petromyzon marinus]XP_032823317.1 titin-like [Petromyzon marinus]XP_032823318.1 titin-like [Petromyzon marinus]XP_032823319.1 titin-like [Petromyzon marinus]